MSTSCSTKPWNGGTLTTSREKKKASAATPAAAAAAAAAAAPAPAPAPAPAAAPAAPAPAALALASVLSFYSRSHPPLLAPLSGPPLLLLSPLSPSHFMFAPCCLLLLTHPPQSVVCSLQNGAEGGLEIRVDTAVAQVQTPARPAGSLRETPPPRALPLPIHQRLMPLRVALLHRSRSLSAHRARGPRARREQRGAPSGSLLGQLLRGPGRTRSGTAWTRRTPGAKLAP